MVSSASVPESSSNSVIQASAPTEREIICCPIQAAEKSAPLFKGWSFTPWETDRR